jgi:uncharacterized membrane protein YedE/YeeE
MNSVDVASSLAGGAFIGLSAALLLLADGRIAGISGIAARLLDRSGDETPWRLAFLIGLLVGPLLFAVCAGGWPTVRIDTSWPVLAIAGLLVGFGTRIGSGCTSGHGVCGLGRLSLRSFVAVIVFMATAMASVALVRHGVWA